MKNNKLLAILFIIVLILAIAGGFGTYYFYQKSIDNNKKNESLDKKNELIIYGSINSYSTYYCSKINEYHHEKVLAIETETENPILIDVATFDEKYRNINSCVSFSEDSDSYVLYWDNGLKIYNINTKEIKKIDIDIPKNKIEYLSNGLLSGGFVYNDIESNVHYYYDLKNNKKMFTDYTNIHELSDSSSILSNYLYGEKNGNSYILDIKNNNELISRKRGIPGSYASAIISSHCSNEDFKIFFMISDVELMFGFNRQIFNEQGKLVTSLSDDEEVYVEGCQNWNGKTAFSINKVTKVRSYDTNGNLIK